MVFLFPDDDALLLALTSGLVPPAISLAPARAGRDSQGRPWVAPGRSVPRTLPDTLRRLGITTADQEPGDGRAVTNWLAAVPLHRAPNPPALTDQTPVLFELEYAAALVPLVGEMLRLGNDRQGFRRIRKEDRGQRTEDSEDASSVLCPLSSVLLRVVGPPYYTLLRALDQLGPNPPRAYLERSPRVWVEFGYTHPLVEQVRPPDGQMVLLRSPQEWVVLDDAPFRDIYEILEFVLPESPVVWSDAPLTDKLTVPLRLAPGAANEPAELWVLTGDAIEQLDAFVRDADDQLLARLSFAVGESGGVRVAAVRARPGKSGPPALALAGLACRPYLRLPHLLVPVGRRLRPPLRRDAVRALLAPDPDRITWLVPQDDTFVPQSLPDSAFRPLSDWVEYVIDRNAEALTTWVQAARFDFATFVCKEELTASRAAPAERRPRGERPEGAAPEKVPPPAAAPPKPKRKAPAAAPVGEAFAARPTATPSELQQRLKETEQQFLQAEGPLDAPERQALWPELARLNADLRHAADAALCWMNALWEPNEPPAEWAWGWVRSEQALPRPELTAADLDRLLANPQPAGPDLRALAAAVVWASQQKPAPKALRQRLPEVQCYLTQHDHLLPVRAVWLAWHGLTRLAGADVLALARVRDRLLERLLTEGLGAERDLPGFLRFAGQREGDRLRTVRAHAERLRQLAHRWSGFEPGAGFQQTPAYIDLLFAFGMARLGEASVARALVRRAGEALEDSGSAAHAFLLQAFRFRIEQALAGKPHAGALPVELLRELDELGAEEKSLPTSETLRRQGTYIIERMREQSRVLEPQEKFNPYRGTTKGHHDNELVRELYRLPDVRDRQELAARLRKLVAAAGADRAAGMRLDILAQSLPLAARTGESFTEELLRQVIPALEAVSVTEDPQAVEGMAKLLEQGMIFAAHYDYPDLVGAFVSQIDTLLQLPARQPTAELQSRMRQTVLEAAGPLVGQSLRSLRKLGLRDQIDRLLQQVARVALGGQSLEQVRAKGGREAVYSLRLLLHLAAGWLYFDHPDQARPILDAARAWILSPDKKAPERSMQLYVPVVCTYISAAGQAPLEEALGRIEELLTSGRMDRLTNTQTSNAYYSRFHLNVVEAVVLALASDDFALGPAARHWLDDDEYLVRRRIHRDVRAAMAGAGM